MDALEGCKQRVKAAVINSGVAKRGNNKDSPDHKPERHPDSRGAGRQDEDQPWLGVRDDQEEAAQSDPSLQDRKVFEISLAGCLYVVGADKAMRRGDQETSDNERFLEQLWSRPTTNPKPVSATKTTTWIDFATGS
jgi:hypothetical protein